jgi:flavin reductase (DIM6/NTAB) family NADH-FMN oxidoreductase RutF
MNLTSGDYPYGADEFKIAGLTPVPSDLVRPWRVLESHVNMECRVAHTIDLSDRPAGATMIVGEVIRFHVDDAIVDNYRVDADKLRAVARMGGNEYSRTRERFELIRPKV